MYAVLTHSLGIFQYLNVSHVFDVSFGSVLVRSHCRTVTVCMRSLVALGTRVTCVFL